MATNKHALIRYHTLDRCFSNHGRKFFIEDLVHVCNIAIYDFSGIKDGVKIRQIYDDIMFMESEQGWSIPLERIKEGKKVYYRYSDKTFSIKNQGINQHEAEQLVETLAILSRFKGLPQFEWIEEMQVRLEGTFKLKGKSQISVGFEQNPYLKGLSQFSDLFNAIQGELALEVNYQGYKQMKSISIVFHPWYLKQFNNRWFVFGYNEELNAISNLALDRITLLRESKVKYRKNIEINFEEYFEDIVGVTIKQGASAEKVILRIASEVWPYIESKPLHGSQKIKSKTETSATIELTVQINHELIALIFSYLDGIEVVEPQILRDRFKSISESLYQKYS